MTETSYPSHSSVFFTHATLHTEVNRLNPRKSKCENCDIEGPTHYALKHGSQYSLDRQDYLELCPLCHKNYDHHNSSINCTCVNKNIKYEHGEAFKLIERLSYNRVCASQKCTTQFTTLSVNKIYCSSACRVAAFRVNHGIITKKEREHTHCQREGCNNEIGADRQSNSKYCSNACNQAVYNKKHAAELSAKRLKVRIEKAKAREKAKKRKDIRTREKVSKDLADEFLKELIDNE